MSLLTLLHYSLLTDGRILVLGLVIASSKCCKADELLYVGPWSVWNFLLQISCHSCDVLYQKVNFENESGTFPLLSKQCIDT